MEVQGPSVLVAGTEVMPQPDAMIHAWVAASVLEKSAPHAGWAAVALEPVPVAWLMWAVGRESMWQRPPTPMWVAVETSMK